jgi:hypothetical protein
VLLNRAFANPRNLGQEFERSPPVVPSPGFLRQARGTLYNLRI